MELQGVTFYFDEEDLEKAKKWWKKKKYSPVVEGEILISALMDGIIQMDIIESGEIVEE